MPRADLVFRRMDRSTCGWTRVGAYRRTSGKPPRRARACRCDLRIRRGKEVAENRQSHCPVAADTIYGTSCGVISAAARPMNSEQRRIHPATRTFQALRIFVNRELDDLRALVESGAPDSEARWTRGGDQFSLAGRSHREGCLPRGSKAGYFRLLTKKPLTATEEESDRNPRARSAKLRAAEKF